MASARDTRFDMMDITSPCYQLPDKTLDVMRDSLALASEDAVRTRCIGQPAGPTRLLLAELYG
jgi:hypothetical protein